MRNRELGGVEWSQKTKINAEVAERWSGQAGRLRDFGGPRWACGRCRLGCLCHSQTREQQPQKQRQECLWQWRRFPLVAWENGNFCLRGLGRGT